MTKNSFIQKVSTRVPRVPLLSRSVYLVVCMGYMMTSTFAQTSKINAPLTIYNDYPGGNILVDSIVGDQIYIHQDINGIWGNWFYWNFKVKGATPGKTYTFNFTHPWEDVKKMQVVGVHGPAISLDEGKTWTWAGKENTTAHSFTYTFPSNTSVVQLSAVIPYTEADYTRFMERYKNHPNVYERGLTVSEGGRKVECLHIGKVAGNVSHKVLITARHHACESMGSFVLEGLIEAVLEDDTDGKWLRENVEFLLIPFMDKDGVEESRQGKNQRPRDHNSDYKGESLWASVSALKSFVPKWGGQSIKVALDIHCPFISGGSHESVYMVENFREPTQVQQSLFSAHLERSVKNSLPYKESNNIKFGTSWNKGKKDSRFSDWAHSMNSVRLVSTIEMPYANASGTVVTAENTRVFGRDLASAIAKYLQTESQESKVTSTQQTPKSAEQETPKTTTTLVPHSTGLPKGIESWINGRVNYYTKNLNLNEQQAQQIRGFFTESAKRGAEIKETLKGEEQKKASWQNQREREHKVNSILTEEQKKKMAELEKK